MIRVVILISGCLLAPPTTNGQFTGYPSRRVIVSRGISPVTGTIVDPHAISRTVSHSDVHIDRGLGVPVEHVQTRTSIGHGLSGTHISRPLPATVDLVPGRRPGTVVQSVHIPLVPVRQTAHVDRHGEHGNLSGRPSLHIETEHGLPGTVGGTIVPPIGSPVSTDVRGRRVVTTHIDRRFDHGNPYHGPSEHVHSIDRSVSTTRAGPGIRLITPIGIPIGLPTGHVGSRGSHVVQTAHIDRHIDPPFTHRNPHAVPAEHVQTHVETSERSGHIHQVPTGPSIFDEEPFFDGRRRGRGFMRRRGRRGRRMFRNIARRLLGI